MSFEEAVSEIVNTLNKKEALRKAYEILTAKYRGYRFKTYMRFFDMFETDIKTLWAKNGFLHCTSLNFLLKELLKRSGKFTDQDFKTRWTLIWFISPHQYLHVQVDNGEWVAIDMWGKAYGIQFGDYAHGFH